MSLRLDDELKADLELVAEADGCSQNELVVQAVRARLDLRLRDPKVRASVLARQRADRERLDRWRR